MISIPVYDTIQGLTVFRDDEDPTSFYYLPRQPRIATDESGKAQFTFLYYQFPVDRPGASGEKGGGYLTFTTALKEDPKLVEQVRSALQSRYRAENPTEAVPKQVKLATVDFTDGTVSLLTFKDQRFVKEVTLGKPSLFADNTASIAAELPADGATLFREALKGGGSVGAVQYSLTFPVRLPAITILGHVDSQEVKNAVMGYAKEKVTSDDTWGNEESHEVAHRTSISETMESQGLIKLEILKGNVNLSQEDMESLRAFAFRAMDEFIKNNFLKGGTIETAADRESQWMSFLGQDIRRRFDLNVSYRDVVARPYNPSAQVNPDFLCAPLDKVVMDIDLGNAPWYFNTLEVAVDTNLDFQKYGDLVHSVVGHLSYDQPRPDGTRLTKRESFAFTANDRAPKSFKTRIADVGKDFYTVEIEVNYKSGPVTQSKLKSFETMVRNLTLDVPNPGVIDLNFAAAASSFDGKLQSIEVEIRYADQKRKVADTTETILLDQANPTRDYRRVIYAPWDQPLQYRPTYVFKDDNGDIHRSTGEWIEQGPGSGQKQFITLNSPFDETLGVTILPAADWKEVAQILVDLEYEDSESDYRVATTKSFSEAAKAPQMWRFPLRNPKRRNYRWSQTLLLTNNVVEQKPWSERDSDAQALIVGNAPGGVVTVTVDPSDVDFTAVKRMIVRLLYADAAHEVSDSEVLVFKDATAQPWVIARQDANANDYTYDIEYVMSDGSHRERTGQKGRVGGINDFLFAPGPPDA
ncbi:MAG: hypothetical protein ACE15D_14985 [Candidatus Eisenbacteria bacterium]